ncbi:MAG: DNRLRE domain-containing protein [Candidatus Eiseniibacteriota bacterium]
MRTHRPVAAATTAFVLLAAASSFAETLHLAVRDVTTVDDGLGNARIFFNLATPGDLGYIAISRATVRMDLTGAARGGTLDLRVHPVAAAWTPGAVTWATRFDESVYGRTEVDLSRTGAVALDMTLLMKEALEGGVNSNGFVLTAAAADSAATTDARGIQSADVSRLANLGTATVEIKYRRTPPPKEVRDRRPR